MIQWLCSMQISIPGFNYIRTHRKKGSGPFWFQSSLDKLFAVQTVKERRISNRQHQVGDCPRHHRYQS